jgi:hypothetical protein
MNLSSPSPAESGITAEQLAQRPWRLLSSDGACLSEACIFARDGEILGCGDPDLRSWRLDDAGRLEILRADGSAGWVLRRIDAQGAIALRSEGLRSAPGAGPMFVQTPPSIGCFLRAHYWDDGVARAHAQLCKAWGAAVAIAADQTRPFAIPEGTPRLDHSLRRFETLGLPLLPQRRNALWHNGDYILYDLMLRTEHDHVILAEYDLAVNCDLRALAEKAAQSGVDLVIDGFGKRLPEYWIWARDQQAWDRRERGDAPPRPLFGSFFPFVFISRRAALWLFARRIANARLRETHPGGGAPWPFCESFVPTELVAAGFAVRSLSELAPAPVQMSDREFHSWSVFDKLAFSFVHPMLSGKPFIDRAAGCALHDHAGDSAAQLADLRRARGRTEAPDEIAALDAAIAGLEAAAPG